MTINFACMKNDIGHSSLALVVNNCFDSCEFSTRLWFKDLKSMLDKQKKDQFIANVWKKTQYFDETKACSIE